MSEQDLHDRTSGLVAEVLDLIAEDAEFRAALKADPESAMEGAGFSARIDQLVDEVNSDAEVSGFATIAPTINGLSAGDLKQTTIVASNTATPGCAGAIQNRYLGDFGSGGFRR